MCGILCSDSIGADDSSPLQCHALSLGKFLVLQKITVPSPSVPAIEE